MEAMDKEPYPFRIENKSRRKARPGSCSAQNVHSSWCVGSDSQFLIVQIVKRHGDSLVEREPPKRSPCIRLELSENCLTHTTAFNMSSG